MTLQEKRQPFIKIYCEHRGKKSLTNVSQSSTLIHKEDSASWLSGFPAGNLRMAKNHQDTSTY